MAKCQLGADGHLLPSVGKRLPGNEAHTEESKNGEGQMLMRFFEPLDPAVVEVYTWAVWLCEFKNALLQLSQTELNFCHLHQSVLSKEVRLPRTSLYGLEPYPTTMVSAPWIPFSTLIL